MMLVSIAGKNKNPPPEAGDFCRLPPHLLTENQWTESAALRQVDANPVTTLLNMTGAGVAAGETRSRLGLAEEKPNSERGHQHEQE